MSIYRDRLNKRYEKRCKPKRSVPVRISSKSKEQTTLDDINPVYDFDGNLRDTYPHTKWDYGMVSSGEAVKSCHNPKITHIGGTGSPKMGRIQTHWRACCEASCPNSSCHNTWKHTSTHHCLSRFVKYKELNPEKETWLILVAVRDEFMYSYNTHMKDTIARHIGDLFKALGIDAYHPVPHAHQIHDDVKQAMIDDFKAKYGETPTGSMLYKLVLDVDYLNSIGFNFETWHDAVSPLYHWHIPCMSETNPEEKLKELMSSGKAFTKFIRANIYSHTHRTSDFVSDDWKTENKNNDFSSNSYTTESNADQIKRKFRARVYNSQELVWEFIDYRHKSGVKYLKMYNEPEPDDFKHTVILRHFNVQGFYSPRYRQRMSGSQRPRARPIASLKDFVNELEYVFGHAATSNKRGLKVKSAGTPRGALHDLKVDVNSANADPYATRARDAMQEAGYLIKWIGNRVYPTHDAPDFNEDAPAKTEQPEDPNWIPIQEYEIPYIVDKETGKLIEAPWARDVKTRRREYLQAVEEMVLVRLADGSIMYKRPSTFSDYDPTSTYNPTVFLRQMFWKLDENAKNPKIRASDKGVFLYEVDGFEEYIANGYWVDGGRCSKKTFFGKYLRHKSGNSSSSESADNGRSHGKPGGGSNMTVRINGKLFIKRDSIRDSSDQSISSNG